MTPGLADLFLTAMLCIPYLRHWDIGLLTGLGNRRGLFIKLEKGHKVGTVLRQTIQQNLPEGPPRN